MRILTAQRLRAGDLVALVSPAGVVRPEQAASAAAVLESWGLRTRLGASALRRHGFFAGTDDERLADLDDALRDPEVRGVVCLRGGYGTQRIVDRLDYAAVRRDPKLIMGFSDITALHAALWCETGLVTVHGPTGASLAESAEAARRALMTAEPIAVKGTDGTGGAAAGILLGGNLTMLATNVGTPHQLDLRGAILLLEEVNEAPYHVDRALTQLRRSGSFDGLAGIALGRFTPELPEEVLRDRLGSLNVPLLCGLEIGHDGPQVAVGLGVSAHLDAAAGTLTVQPACR